MVINSDGKNSNGFYTYIKVDPTKTKLKTGQRLRIEGIIYTIKEINPPTNENGTFSQKIELSVLTGYLICQKCKGYYKLQPGESPEDFTDVCACGGKLSHVLNIDVVKSNEPQPNNKNEQKKQVIITNNQTPEGNYLLQARGTTGLVELYKNGVRICSTSKSSFKELYNFHFKNTEDYEKYFVYNRFVTFDEINYVIYRKAKFLAAGYIRFILNEDGEDKRKFLDSNSDEKQIGFRPNQQPMFDKIHEIIESKLS